MAPPKNNPNKFDPTQTFRSEIESRTAAGETCEQIASALRAKGVDITNKTISRRRVEWGLRKRPFNKLLGKKVNKPRPRKAGTKTARTNLRKAEIEARTARGETAAEIVQALEGQGHVFKSGESTVLRLQTTWGLIEPDEVGARRRKPKKRKDGVGATMGKSAAPKGSKRELEREANRRQRNHTQHYPVDCSFGPKRRIIGVAAPQGDDVDDHNLDPQDPSNQLLSLPFNDFSPSTSNPQAQQPSISIATELMSVEFLVDLANSTLVTATSLKEMLLAYQAGQPAPNSVSGLPPTLEELSTARRKVREAAGVMHDLAVEPEIGAVGPG